MIHKLNLETKNLHGSFNNGYEPIITIDSGDSIQLKTLDIQWGYSGSKDEGRMTFESRENEEKLGHPLIGPIAIRNAKPGMVLEVRLNDLIPGWYGRNWAGGTPNWQNEKLGLIDTDRLQVTGN